MERRLNRNLSSESKGSISLQKELAESKRSTAKENVPDLTDFMNDMFFGTVKVDKKAYNLTGTGDGLDNEEDFDSSTRSVSSRLTQEWLQEAKRMVAASPPRYESPSSRVGSPRFATARATQVATLDRRDPLSRSARRHRAVEGFSGEILSKSAKHARNKSETTFDPPSAEASPASTVQKWISNIIKSPSNPIPSSSPTISSGATYGNTADHPTATILPARQSTHSKSRFQTESQTNHNQPSKRTFKKATSKDTPSALDTNLLSPPKYLIESSHHRTISQSTFSIEDVEVLSPPRNLIESAHRRSISSSTCRSNRIVHNNANVNGQPKQEESRGQGLNGFLMEQRAEMEKISTGMSDKKAKIVLSGPSNSTSSMVAAICYAWLLENRMRANRDAEVEDGGSVVVVPVMSINRAKMWKQRQAAWLFHHVGLDATALLFSDEVDLETLLTAKRRSILVVGQDILTTNGEVGSECTVLTDNYCEDAYDLLQTPILRKLLLAGILIDTQNLDASIKKSTTRDAEAIQLLSVGSAPTYRSGLFDQLKVDQRDDSFLEALRQSYGQRPTRSSRKSGATIQHQIPHRDTTREAMTTPDKTINCMNSRGSAMSLKSAGKSTPSPTQATPTAKIKAVDAPRSKNKFFLAKWFGFGSK